VNIAPGCNDIDIKPLWWYLLCNSFVNNILLNLEVPYEYHDWNYFSHLISSKLIPPLYAYLCAREETLIILGLDDFIILSNNKFVNN